MPPVLTRQPSKVRPRRLLFGLSDAAQQISNVPHPEAAAPQGSDGQGSDGQGSDAEPIGGGAGVSRPLDSDDRREWEPGVTPGWPGAGAWVASTWTASEPRARPTFALNEYLLH